LIPVRKILAGIRRDFTGEQLQKRRKERASGWEGELERR